MEYTEFYLQKIGNDHDQYMLVGSDGQRGDTLAIFFDLHYAELAEALLNNMLEEVTNG